MKRLLLLVVFGICAFAAYRLWAAGALTRQGVKPEAARAALQQTIQDGRKMGQKVGETLHSVRFGGGDSAPGEQ